MQVWERGSQRVLGSAQRFIPGGWLHAPPALPMFRNGPQMQGPFRESALMTLKNLGFVLADHEHARLVRPAANHALHTQWRLDSAKAHQASHDLGTDRPGRFEPRTDPHEQEGRKFAQLVADELATLDCEDFVLVAPAAALGEIEAALPLAMAKRVIGRLQKDLLGVPDDALQPHLAQWVDAPKRGPMDGE